MADHSRLAPPSAVRGRGDRRHKRATLVATAAVAFAIAGIVLAVGSLGGTPDSAPGPNGPARQGPSQSLPSTGDLVTEQTDNPFETARIAPEGVRFSARAIAANESTFVVVGDSSDFGPPGPATYWSRDGLTWTKPEHGFVPDSANVTDVIHTQDGFLAVGVDRSGPAAWRTDDGRRWLESPVVGATGRGQAALWGVGSTSLGYFAWGVDDGSWHLWRSPDGSSWTPIKDAHAFEVGGDLSLCSVQERQGSLHVVGYGAGRRVAWRSHDGETWERVDSRAASGGCTADEWVVHDRARSAAGTVDIYPDGGGDRVFLSPAKSS